jgi:hypothetical protein
VSLIALVAELGDVNMSASLISKVTNAAME